MKILSDTLEDKDITNKSYVDGVASDIQTQLDGKAASSHTHNYAGSSSAGGSANSLAGFMNTTTSATAIDSACTNGHVYVTGTSGIYSQSDGAALIQAYSSSWVGQIYQDYRTGQIALRGKNSGTWQPWRKVLDSSNYSTWAASKASYTGIISTTWSSSAPYTQIVTVTGIATTDAQVHITPIYSTDNATAIAQQKAWNCISKGIVTADNKITFTCFKTKPTAALSISVEVTR